MIKKTSPEYAAEKDPPPCPSVKVNDTFVVKNDIVTFEMLKSAIQDDGMTRDAAKSNAVPT